MADLIIPVFGLLPFVYGWMNLAAFFFRHFFFVDYLQQNHEAYWDELIEKSLWPQLARWSWGFGQYPFYSSIYHEDDLGDPHVDESKKAMRRNLLHGGISMGIAIVAILLHLALGGSPGS